MVFFFRPGIGDEYCYDHDISHGYRRLEQEDSSGAFRYFWWKVQKPKKKTCVFSELSDTGLPNHGLLASIFFSNSKKNMQVVSSFWVDIPKMIS